MKTFSDNNEIQSITTSLRQQGKTIGFVPTMGYFHEGHLNLVRTARKENDVLVVSIFVNPIQFGPKEDFDKYPRNLDRDIELAKNEKVDIIFHPDTSTFYPPGYDTYVNVETLTKGLCGAKRPGHFKGVTTVVTKLFHLVQPMNAYFGQKDIQQAMVVKRMTTDLNFPVNVKILPTTRDEDGLAISSRNVYLEDNQREQALVLYKSLVQARNSIKSGEKCADTLIESMKKLLDSEPDVKIDYIEIVDVEHLAPVKEIQDTVIIASAIFVGNTRLIDNIVLRGADGEEVIP